MKIRLLGSGTSSGVPRIGNDWGACDPADPRNRRTRVSAIIESETTRILIDTGPDMRAQLLAADVDNVDAVIWTHDHADHCHGIDDLRQIYHVRATPVRALARHDTMTSLQQRFAYAFNGRDGYPPTIAGEPLPDRIVIGDIDIHAVDQPHGNITSAGMRFAQNGKSIVYATDFHELTTGMRELYTGADIWIADALRHRPHPTHPTVAQVVGWAAELGVKRTVLIHMDQSLDYATLAAELPPGIEPGYDGLELML